MMFVKEAADRHMVVGYEWTPARCVSSHQPHHISATLDLSAARSSSFSLFFWSDPSGGPGGRGSSGLRDCVTSGIKPGSAAYQAGAHASILWSLDFSFPHSSFTNLFILLVFVLSVPCVSFLF